MLFVQHFVQDSIRLQTKAFQSDSSHGFSVISKMGWVGKYLPASLRLLNFMFLCIVDLLILIITVRIFVIWLLCPYIVHAACGRAQPVPASSALPTCLHVSRYRLMKDELTLPKLFIMRSLFRLWKGLIILAPMTSGLRKYRCIQIHKLENQDASASMVWKLMLGALLEDTAWVHNNKERVKKIHESSYK